MSPSFSLFSLILPCVMEISPSPKYVLNANSVCRPYICTPFEGVYSTTPYVTSSPEGEQNTAYGATNATQGEWWGHVARLAREGRMQETLLSLQYAYAYSSTPLVWPSARG